VKGQKTFLYDSLLEAVYRVGRNLAYWNLDVSTGKEKKNFASFEQRHLKVDMAQLERCSEGRKRMNSDKAEERNNDKKKDSMILSRKERQIRGTNAMGTEF